MLGTLTGFAEELRRAGLPVSLTETLDAARALQHLPLEDREALRAALSATLVKDAAHLPAFSTLFELYFAATPIPWPSDGALLEDDAELGEGSAVPEQGGATSPGEGEALEAAAVAALVAEALASGDPLRLAALARLGVQRFAGFDPSRPVGVSYYRYRVLRALDLEGVLAGLLDQVRAGSDVRLGAAGSLQELSLRRRIAAEQLEAAAVELGRAVETELVARLAAERGVGALAKSQRRALVEDVDFMHATREELAAMRRALRPLSRTLAVRLARRRRRGRRGALDFRATIRRSLSTGGVPISPRFRPPHRAKPEIVVIADVSGSVAAFARFTLHLVHALASQFSAVRTFVFIDGVDEVTAIFRASPTIGEAIERVQREAAVSEGDGHSDYGSALRRFGERYGRAVGPRTTVLVLGDGRSNYHPAQASELAELQRRARRLYWLNPEPRPYWGSGDSVVGEYAPYCDAMVECRNLRQLEAFVDALA